MFDAVRFVSAEWHWKFAVATVRQLSSL